MTPEQIAAAKWYPNSPSTMILKCRAKDGGAVLATISGGDMTGYRWETNTTPRIIGTHFSYYGAQRAARATLKEHANV